MPIAYHKISRFIDDQWMVYPMIHSVLPSTQQVVERLRAPPGEDPLCDVDCAIFSSLFCLGPGKSLGNHGIFPF